MYGFVSIVEFAFIYLLINPASLGDAFANSIFVSLTPALFLVVLLLWDFVASTFGQFIGEVLVEVDAGEHGRQQEPKSPERSEFRKRSWQGSDRHTA